MSYSNQSPQQPPLTSNIPLVINWSSSTPRLDPLTGIRCRGVQRNSQDLSSENNFHLLVYVRTAAQSQAPIPPYYRTSQCNQVPEPQFYTGSLRQYSPRVLNCSFSISTVCQPVVYVNLAADLVPGVPILDHNFRQCMSLSCHPVVQVSASSYYQDQESLPSLIFDIYCRRQFWGSIENC